METNVMWESISSLRNRERDKGTCMVLKEKKENSIYFCDQMTVRKLDSPCYLRGFSIEG